MGWTWRYEDAAGEIIDAPGGTSSTFPTQGDAESWIGETWRELLEAGVARATLLEDQRTVYGPMSLDPEG